MGRRINFLSLFYIVGVSITLTACSAQATPVNLPGSPTPEMEVTPPASPAPLIPSPTIPTPEEISGPQVIGVGNADQLVEQARFGKGTILTSSLFATGVMPVYSPDGLLLAIPTSAGIYIYDALTLEELHRLPVGSTFIFSPEGDLIAAGGRGGISLWDPTTGEKVTELPGNPEDYYGGIAFSADGSLLAIGSWNREITVWSPGSMEKLFTLPGDWLSFSPDGELAVVVTYGENKVYLYETQTGVEVNKWNVRHAGFAPGGQLWLEDDQSVRLLSLDADQSTAPFSGINPSFSADGALMALFADDQISVYDHQKGRRVRVLEGNYTQVNRLLFSPDGSTLAGEVETLHCPSCTEMEGLDPYLVLWRTADGSIITKMEQQGQSGWLGYSLDGSRLAGLQMGDVQILNPADGSIVQQIDGFTAPVEGMALAPDGETLAAVYGVEPYVLRFWDLQEERVVDILQDRSGGAALSNAEIAYSPDQEYLAVRGDLWDLAAGERLSEFEGAITEVTSCWPEGVAFSPQRDSLATGCFDGQLDLWHVPDGELIKRLSGYSSYVNELAYSPDGVHLAAIYNVPDYLIQVWQLPEGVPEFTLNGGHFTRVSYSPDGETLATVLANQEFDQYGWPAGYVQLWSALDGKEIIRLEIEDAVSLAFSPDGQILATGSLDGTLRLWGMLGGRILLESGGHFGQIQRLVFTPDGTSLISASLDGTIIRWGIPDPSSP